MLPSGMKSCRWLKMKEWVSAVLWFPSVVSSVTFLSDQWSWGTIKTTSFPTSSSPCSSQVWSDRILEAVVTADIKRHSINACQKLGAGRPLRLTVLGFDLCTPCLRQLQKIGMLLRMRFSGREPTVPSTCKSWVQSQHSPNQTNQQK